MPTILGIDPGLANTGWGVVQQSARGLVHQGHGTIVTCKDVALEKRLLTLYEKLQELIDTYRPETCGVEALYFVRNVKTAIPVSHARGVVLLAMANRDISVEEFTPLEIKKSVVGVGTAEKTQVQEMVRLLLGQAIVPRPHHAADALAAAICCAHQGDAPCSIV